MRDVSLSSGMVHVVTVMIRMAVEGSKARIEASTALTMHSRTTRFDARECEGCRQGDRQPIDPVFDADENASLKCGRSTANRFAPRYE